MLALNAVPGHAEQHLFLEHTAGSFRKRYEQRNEYVTRGLFLDTWASSE
jgi:hypothetical protein